ncbi:hypothetical protein [Vibrio splendidus]|uniref:hypothetical protein n=1 Tax=Vibrio splendidus TaxID=29497 RepID=UPI0013012F4E
MFPIVIFTLTANTRAAIKAQMTIVELMIIGYSPISGAVAKNQLLTDLKLCKMY